ncbi:MAG: hypothetical protein D6744_00040 [Planctomycetota bacterium]|nr:MAG: hypothetical protein D6744_00040 [Planctomycetota bacterium]
MRLDEPEANWCVSVKERTIGRSEFASAKFATGRAFPLLAEIPEWTHGNNETGLIKFRSGARTRVGASEQKMLNCNFVRAAFTMRSGITPMPHAKRRYVSDRKHMSLRADPPQSAREAIRKDARRGRRSEPWMGNRARSRLYIGPVVFDV